MPLLQCSLSKMHYQLFAVVALQEVTTDQESALSDLQHM